MSVRREKRRDPSTGKEREILIVDFVFRFPDGRKERVRKVAPVSTKREAEEYERQLRAELLSPKPVAKVAPTFRKYVEDDWLPLQKAENHENTIEEKRSHLKHHLFAAFGTTKLDAIDAPAVKRFVAELRTKTSKRTGKPLHVKTVRNIVATLHRILVEAEIAGYIGKVPHFPAVKVPSSEHHALSADDAQKLLAHAADDEERTLLLFALRTGVRAGEQIALQWTRVDLDKGSARIMRSSSRGKIGSTKSKKERYVYLTPDVRAALESLPRRAAEVFTQKSGKPHTYGTLKHRLRSALERAGLEPRRWHDLRHSYGTTLAEAGIPLAKVQKLLGHSTITTTMRYVHVGTDADLDLALDGPKYDDDRADDDGNDAATDSEEMRRAPRKRGGPMVGVTGFEPVTSTV